MTRIRTAAASGAIALAMALGVCAPDLARAQSRDFGDLSARVDRLQRDIDTLQRTVYQGRPPPPAAAPASGALPPDARFQADMEVRIDQLESRIAQLTGRAEEIEHQIGLMRQRLDKLAADNQARAGGPPAAAATPGAAPPAEASAAPPAATAPAATAAAQPSPNLAGPGAPPRPLGTIPAGAVPAGPPPPAQPQQPAAAAAPAQVASLPAGTPRQQYEYATSLLAKQDYPAAESALKAFVAAHPKDPLAGSAQFWIGETHFVRKDYQNAAFAYADGIEKFPQGPKAPDSLLKLGMSLARLGKTDQACTALSRLKASFPNASEVVKRRAAAEATDIKCKG
jgi:tol-pal system protein YbgF